MIVKYMDRGWVIKANNYASKRGWEKTISLNFLNKLTENEIIPISFVIPEDDEKITITLTFGAQYDKTKAVNKELHIPNELYLKLPEVEMPDLESDDDCDAPAENPMSAEARKFLENN